MSFTPTSSNVKIQLQAFAGGGNYTLTRATNGWTTYAPGTVAVNVCNVGADYRYGFNGQMKTNEWAGIGNHNTSLFGEFDTRTGKRNNPDPKPDAGWSLYSTFQNNPILNKDPLGDSVGATFYDQNGNQTNQIPEVLQKQFNDEYGIALGYNSKTQMLYQAGSITTKEKTSPTGVSMWQKELGVGHSEFKLETGYNMFRKSSAGPDPVIFGEYHPTNKTTYMDLADFNTNGTAKFMDASRSYIDVPSRAFNMARVLEHEYFGHGIMKLRDNIVQGGTQAGNNEDKLSNPIRKELGLPLRMNYSIRAEDYQIEGPGKQAPAMHFSNGGIMYMMKENVIESTKGHEIPQN